MLRQFQDVYVLFVGIVLDSRVFVVVVVVDHRVPPRHGRLEYMYCILISSHGQFHIIIGDLSYSNTNRLFPLMVTVIFSLGLSFLPGSWEVFLFLPPTVCEHAHTLSLFL